MKCPVKNARYKELLEELGSDDAVYKVWVDNGYKLPGDTEDGIVEPLKFEKQYAYFSRIKTRLTNKLNTLTKDTEAYITLKAEIDAINNKLKSTGVPIKQSYNELGTIYLDKIEAYIKKWEDSGQIKNFEHIAHTIDAINTFSLGDIAEESVGLETRAKELYDRLTPFLEAFVLEQVNKYSTEGKDITLEDIKKITTDIGKFTLGTGALADVEDYLARTIGAIIKEAQNKVTTDNKKLTEEVQTEVDLLKEWGKKNGVEDKNLYDVFIQDFNKTTTLTKQYTTKFYNEFYKHIRNLKSENITDRTLAKAWLRKNTVYSKEKTIQTNNPEFINKNYLTIQNTPELKRFYDFHKKITLEAKEKLPVDIKGDFIANIKKNVIDDISHAEGLVDKLSIAAKAIGNLVDVKHDIQGQFTGDEELFADIVPIKFVKSLDKSEKSRDLGSNILQFASFANSYEQMSDVLPKVRLLQEEIKRKQYIKTSEPHKRVSREESNIFKMTEAYIKMQVKGQSKLSEGKIKVGNVYDDKGNKIGDKYILTSEIVDLGLRYNSILRIGFNPFNAVSNVLIGDIGNIVEGFGGRFYTTGNLLDASKIFFKQVNTDDSDLNKWLEKLNPLQEMEDFEQVDQVRLKGKLTPEGFKNLMYSPQKLGEKYLQTRTMLAVLLKEGYIDSNGKTTTKGENLTTEQLSKLSDKIQRLNQSIHGRYSQRDAATLQQNVLYRMVSQFRKWIPAAIEQRVGDTKYDPRLGVTIEGRYKSAWRLIQLALKGDFNRLKTENLSEVELYNMKKNFAELTILAFSILAFYGLKGEDDDKEWRKNPSVKFTLDQLNRVSGDLLFFYTPEGATRTALNAVPLAKTADDLRLAFGTIPTIFTKHDRYIKGRRKGELKIGRFGDLIPLYKPTADVLRTFKDVAYEEPK